MKKHEKDPWIRWKDICLMFNPWEKIVFHFVDYNKETYAELIGFNNYDARISTMYVGTDGILHITFYDEYKGRKAEERKDKIE